MSVLGEAIKVAREAGGLSRAQLAERARISHVFVGKIEQGKRNPSPPTFGRIARVLGLTVAELRMRAELVSASSRATEDELTRQLIRSVALGVGVRAVLPIVGIGPWAAAALGINAAKEYVRTRQQESEMLLGREMSAKQKLQAFVDQLSEADAEMLLSALDP